MPGFLKNQKGSFTVEASIVLPIVLLSIIAVIYICMLLYQTVLLQASADRSVERGTATWSNPKKEMASGNVAIGEVNAGGLYWRLYDLHKDEKTDRVSSYFKSQMGKFDILKGDYEIGEPVINDLIIYKKLSVEVESRYGIPIGKLLKHFGLKDKITLKVRSEAVVNDPAEFIRNTDFIMETEKELEQSNEGAAKLGNTVRGSMQKVMDALADFFDKK